MDTVFKDFWNFWWKDKKRKIFKMLEEEIGGRDDGVGGEGEGPVVIVVKNRRDIDELVEQLMRNRS